MTGKNGPRWPHKWRPDARQLLGSHPVAFDTMILTALVRANKAQMLVESMAPRAKIAWRVGGELRGHARGDPAISAVIPPLAGGPRPVRAFGEMIVLTRHETKLAADFQHAWHGQDAIDADPHKDRGEAECLAICITRGWPLMSQDHKAVETGAKRGVKVYGLPELLMLFAAEGRCMPASAWTIYSQIAANPTLVAQGWECSDEVEELFGRCCGLMAKPEAA